MAQQINTSDASAYDDTKLKRRIIKAALLLQSEGCPVFFKDGRLFVSGESENSFEWLDYYGEYRGGYPWTSERLNQILAKFKLAGEWENPGCLMIVEA